MIKGIYEKKLQDIEKLLKREKFSDAKRALEKLEKFKPMSLKMILLQANYYLLLDDYNAFRNTLDNKWLPHYAYDGIVEAIESYEQIWEKFSNKRESSRHHFMKELLQYIGTETKEGKSIEQQWSCLNVMGEEYYLSGKESTLLEIGTYTYRLSEMTWNYIVQFYFREKNDPGFLATGMEWIETMTNMGYLKERLEEPGTSFILIAEEGNKGMCRAIGRMLSKMGKKVYFLQVPEKWSQNGEINPVKLLERSLNKKVEDDYNIKLIPTYYVEETEYRLDNRALLIQYLTEQEISERLATVIGSGALLDDLGMQECLKKSFSRFNFGMGDIFENNFSFGWAGDYIRYISKIYNYDVLESLKRKCEACKYSIVIPARNSAESLRYTLQTCLELDYPKEAYEIVISDNSTNNNAEVYNLCQELNDPRIQYYRTPRDLHLPKSFEFAFLQTKGEFILSLGSDDAILPWALRVLDEIRAKYPQEEIIQWERGFYAWPGFNGGQQHQFVIPRAYKQDEYNEGYIRGEDYLRQVLNNPASMYGLPMLYINSGFKRTYMNTLLEKTGRLWDGICQDIYIAVINIVINDRILNLRYPLTIAGMTNSSVGATCVRANMDDAQSMKFNDDIRKTANIGGFSMSMTERLMPELRSDVSSLYNSLLRAVARGILPEEYMWKKFNWKKMFSECIQRLDIRDVEFDKLIHYARYTASWHGQEFLQWFDKEIYNKVMEPKLIDERAIRIQKKKKTYQEGKTAEGGLVVDASNYGVTNSYEAAQLFQKLSGLQ